MDVWWNRSVLLGMSGKVIGGLVGLVVSWVRKVFFFGRWLSNC